MFYWSLRQDCYPPPTHRIRRPRNLPAAVESTWTVKCCVKRMARYMGIKTRSSTNAIDESFVDDHRNIHQAVLDNRVSHDHRIQDDRKIAIWIEIDAKDRQIV